MVLVSPHGDGQGMRMMKRPAPLLLLLLALGAPAQAQEELGMTSTPPEKMSILVTYGDEPCPEATGDEIVVCAQRPESDRYRVPKELRHQDEEVPVGGGSWASKVEGYDDIARVGRPNSCSAVGSYGFTGCAAAALRDWFAARRSMNR